MEIREKIQKVLEGAVFQTVGQDVEIKLEHPAVEEHGDYSSNIAFQFKNQENLANKIKEKLGKDEELKGIVEKIEVVDGFINFWLSKEALAGELHKILEDRDYGKAKNLSSKKFVVEHTSPNTNKPLHVGHIRNNVLAMAVIRLLEASGNKVVPVEIINDRGTHICKSMMGYLYAGLRGLEYGKSDLTRDARAVLHKTHGIAEFDNQKRHAVLWRELLSYWNEHPDWWITPKEAGLKGDHFVGKFYVIASQEEEIPQPFKGWIHEMLVAWEEQDGDVRKLWKKMNDWFYEGVEETYKALDSIPSQRWYESEIYQEGKKIVEDDLGGLFEKKEDGSVVAKLEKYGMEDKVVLRRDGTSVYITQDLALLRDRKSQIDGGFYVYVVAQEQALHFKQLFAMAEELKIARTEELYHLGYGLVRLTTGAMSSREGNVINADDLILKMKTIAQGLVEAGQTKKEMAADGDGLADAVGTGALKYGVLRYSPSQDIVFDVEKSISFEGNSAPYLQYTHARCLSVLEKSGIHLNKLTHLSETPRELNTEEIGVLRTIYKFPEVVGEAAESYSPNLLCNFLFDLAQKYNAFYNKHRILQSTDYRLRSKDAVDGGRWTVVTKEQRAFRLALTVAVANILKTGLNILGIVAPAKM